MAILKELENRYLGQRCFLFGCGPSINKTKGIENIKGETCFGVNDFHHNYPFSCYPTFLAIADGDMMGKRWESLSQFKTTLFVGGVALSVYRKAALESVSDVIPMEMIYPGRVSNCDAEPNLMEHLHKLKERWGTIGCGTVIMDVALPVVYKLGFSEIYVLGVDLMDDGHFYGKGGTSRLAQPCYLNRLQKNFGVWNDFLKEEGRAIYNATEGGELRAFDRVSLEEVLK